MDALHLIDWKMVGFASLWILGLAIILTVLGFASYHAEMESKRTRQVLSSPGYQAPVNAGLALFCLGVLGSSRVWWETVLWASLAVAFIVFTVSALRAARGAEKT